MKRLSDINKCNLENYPENTKKRYCGLERNWIYQSESFSNNLIYTWEFGWKQKALKESYDVDYYNYKIHRYKQYLLYDYNSCFIIFKIHVEEKDGVINYCRLYLDSVDDGDFSFDFNYKYLDVIKSYFKKNYKILTFEKIEEFMKSLI